MNWVHRDISSGNIMLCGDVAKITDFEYAKRLTQPGEVDDTRTVTFLLVDHGSALTLHAIGHRRLHGNRG